MGTLELELELEFRKKKKRRESKGIRMRRSNMADLILGWLDLWVGLLLQSQIFVSFSLLYRLWLWMDMYLMSLLA